MPAVSNSETLSARARHGSKAARRRRTDRAMLCAAGVLCASCLLTAPLVLAAGAGKRVSVAPTTETRRLVVTIKLAAEAAGIPERIAEAQNKLIADLSRFPVRVTRRANLVPQIALTIDKAGELYIRQHPAVVEVAEDEPAKPAAQSAGGAPTTR